MSRTVEDRFWSNVDLTLDCWEWIGGLDRDGYGRLHVAGRYAKAHRFAYELLVGPIPAGLTIDHLCRNRRCVNPAHLEPVTNRVNTLRGIGPTAVNATKTRCCHGHEFTAENTYVRPDGQRKCNECRRRYQREYRPVGRRRDVVRPRSTGLVFVPNDGRPAIDSGPPVSNERTEMEASMTYQEAER